MQAAQKIQSLVDLKQCPSMKITFNHKDHAEDKSLCMLCKASSNSMAGTLESFKDDLVFHDLHKQLHLLDKSALIIGQAMKKSTMLWCIACLDSHTISFSVSNPIGAHHNECMCSTSKSSKTSLRKENVQSGFFKQTQHFILFPSTVQTPKNGVRFSIISVTSMMLPNNRMSLQR